MYRHLGSILHTAQPPGTIMLCCNPFGYVWRYTAKFPVKRQLALWQDASLTADEQQQDMLQLAWPCSGRMVENDKPATVAHGSVDLPANVVRSAMQGLYHLCETGRVHAEDQCARAESNVPVGQVPDVLARLCAGSAAGPDFACQ